MFDRLLLLEKGGNELYFGEIGPNASTMIEYFENNGAPPCPPGANPAEWVVEMTRTSATELGEKAKSVAVNWPHTWSRSPQKERIRKQLAEMKERFLKKPDMHRIHPTGEYAASFSRQLLVVLGRAFKNYWRDPLYLYSRFGLCICVVSFSRVPLQPSQTKTAHMKC